MSGAIAFIVMAFGLAAQVGCAPAELPVVATGRWVELATDRDDPICAGTVDALDAIVGAGFEVLGETPPDDVFIRYEWLAAPRAASYTRPHGDGILIETDQLVEEHELAHAVHQMAWPRSASFMHEGLAILLDSRRMYNPVTWSGQITLDELLEDSLEGGRNYTWAWFLVSQIVFDHGFEGLRELWHAVPAGASAAEVRAAYSAIFGRSIDALIDTRIDVTVYEGMTYETEVLRYPCLFSLCPQAPVFVDESASILAPGPSGCEDDPEAIGPHSREFVDGPPVWRQMVVESDAGLNVTRSEELTGMLRPCSLRCDGWGNGQGKVIDPGPREEVEPVPAGRWRVEVRRDLEGLPTQEPGALEVRALTP